MNEIEVTGMINGRSARFRIWGSAAVEGWLEVNLRIGGRCYSWSIPGNEWGAAVSLAERMEELAAEDLAVLGRGEPDRLHFPAGYVWS